MTSLPASMRVIEAPKPGGPEVLVPGEKPVPSCGDDDVLIKVAAAGLNRADILQRRGYYPSPPGAPPNPGLEASGTVVVAGRNVGEFKVGDAVCALLQGGGYSEYCAVHAGQVLPVPNGLTLIEAASLPEAYFTVWSNLYEFGRLQRGETLLVHGGSSGIGISLFNWPQRSAASYSRRSGPMTRRGSVNNSALVARSTTSRRTLLRRSRR